MKNNVDFSNSEQGVRLYKLHADCFNPLTFWLTEEWNTVSDLKNHFLSESYIKNAELTAGKVFETKYISSIFDKCPDGVITKEFCNRGRSLSATI